MIQATTRLYLHDSSRFNFEATVVAAQIRDGVRWIALDQSAFYPEGGGQPADQGTINGLPVTDVQANDDVVWHALGAAGNDQSLDVDAHIHGAIDPTRRLDHMQQHCGQHILSAAFQALCGAATVGFHLGERIVTIDLDIPALQRNQVQAVEDLANQIVWGNLPVTVRILARDELNGLALRKTPTVAGPVRVVSIDDFDHSACGGTHPAYTGTVGMIAVLRWTRQRGGVRVSFACGGRALNELRRLNQVASEAAEQLSVGLDELPIATKRLLTTQQALQRQLATAEERLLDDEAERLYAAGELVGAKRVVQACFADWSIERLRTLAEAIAARPGGIALLGSSGTRANLVVACAPESGYEANQLLAHGLPQLAGRGGGNARLAQGGSPQSEHLEAALGTIRQQIQA
ncbi:alanyl-tRNA editing protein [Candidatus Chloroploca asiatica]|uniref:alanyl-tRNA editing protein n=1 Tax=Candidatus Chloroploca asiatica TaxID=1506545 RepID=UPI000BEA16C4|nr:DHHA1 domain-containing protein [Candidatus Chloroploca asiatica]